MKLPEVFDVVLISLGVVLSTHCNVALSHLNLLFWLLKKTSIINIIPITGRFFFSGKIQK